MNKQKRVPEKFRIATVTQILEMGTTSRKSLPRLDVSQHSLHAWVDPLRVTIIVASIGSQTLVAAMKEFSGPIKTDILRLHSYPVAAGRRGAAEVVAKEVGVAVGTLQRWREDAQAKPARMRAWTAPARLEAVITTTAMSQADNRA